MSFKTLSMGDWLLSAIIVSGWIIMLLSNLQFAIGLSLVLIGVTINIARAIEKAIVKEGAEAAEKSF